MPRKTTSQWNFGELFPPQATRQVFAVGDLTRRIKTLLEQQIGQVWVSGEISNFRAQSSGHLYFTLKDATAQLSCVLFRGTAVPDRAALRDGQKVVLQGDLSVYEPRGQYQLIVRAAELQGVGALQAAFERLKQKLQAEGLFDPARKRPLPRFPRRVGLVTSPTAAALRDVLHVIGRRFAGLELVLAPCRVQGQGAEREIAAALDALNRWSASAPERHLDVILVTRGGGSLEDLWAFNEEAVARAIVASAIPVISGVGHEIDFTIADFAADLRAATPSAAAEILTDAYVSSRETVEGLRARLARVAASGLEDAAEAVEALRLRLARAHPRRRLEERAQRLDDLAVALARRTAEGLRQARQQSQALAARLAAVRPSRQLDRARTELARTAAALADAGREAVARRREALARLSLRLELLSPDRILSRGYSITLLETTGRVLRDPAEAPPGTVLLTRLHSGGVRSVTTPPDPAPPGDGGIEARK